MSTREDLLRLTLQEGCWYNLRSRKALEDSKGHTTKSPLVTNKTAVRRSAWIRLWRSGSCATDSDSCDVDDPCSRRPSRERESRDSRDRLGGLISESASSGIVTTCG